MHTEIKLHAEFKMNDEGDYIATLFHGEEFDIVSKIETSSPDVSPDSSPFELSLTWEIGESAHHSDSDDKYIRCATGRAVGLAESVAAIEAVYKWIVLARLARS